MPSLIKHIGLFIGVTLVFVSFLFFGRQQDSYQLLLLSGIMTSLIFYLFILFGKGHYKTKSFWTLVIIICVIVEQLVEPFLIDSSYNIYISQNKSTLTEINEILLHKKGDIIVLKDKITAKGDTLTSSEIAKLRNGRKKLGVYLISKFDKGIYYSLWGFLDVRLGVTYLPSKTQSDIKYRHLGGNWFH